jgi:hypothetical protein
VSIIPDGVVLWLEYRDYNYGTDKFASSIDLLLKKCFVSLVQTATTEPPSHLLESFAISIFAPLSNFDDYEMSPKQF